MQENVRFFDAKLHKNANFRVRKVHKNVKSVILIGQTNSELNENEDRRGKNNSAINQHLKKGIKRTLT